MNKTLRKAIAALMALAMWVSGPASAFAQSAPIQCAPAPALVLAYFNGVQNTMARAMVNLEELARIHGPRAPTGEPILYRVMYNSTTGFDDFIETFEQRTHETSIAGRFELFFETIAGGGPWSTALGDLFVGLNQDAVMSAVAGIANLLTSPPTQSNLATHQSRVRAWARDGRKMVFVAHSQGNLFANAAYDYALALVGAQSVRVVHIAPGSPTLRGSHTLADKDLVINALRLAGPVPPITDIIPGALLRPPGLTNDSDAMGHGLLAIYLNPHLSTAARIRQHIWEAMATVVFPPVAPPRQPSAACPDPSPPVVLPGGDVPFDPVPIRDPFAPPPAALVLPPVPPPDAEVQLFVKLDLQGIVVEVPLHGPMTDTTTLTRQVGPDYFVQGGGMIFHGAPFPGADEQRGGNPIVLDSEMFMKDDRDYVRLFMLQAIATQAAYMRWEQAVALNDAAPPEIVQTARSGPSTVPDYVWAHVPPPPSAYGTR